MGGGRTCEVVVEIPGGGRVFVGSCLVHQPGGAVECHSRRTIVINNIYIYKKKKFIKDESQLSGYPRADVVELNMARKTVTA
jgi:hypothetical protein